MIHIEQRASTVLYKFLVSNCKGYHFLIPANVCTVVPLTFLKAGIDFSFVDIDLKTHAGSFVNYMEFVHSHKGEKLGVLFVNAYGARQDTCQFYKDLKSLNADLFIIEDDCLCVPETQRIVPNESIDLEIYSTGYSKFVQLPIEGGYGLLRENLLYEDYEAPFNEKGYSKQQQMFKTCRIKGETFVYVENDWLPSASMITKDFTVEDYFSEIDKRISISMNHKQEINSIYDRFLPDDLKLGRGYNIWRYNLMFQSAEIRDSIMEALFADDLYASAYYKSAASLFKHEYCANTEKEADCILNLFNEEKYSAQMAERTTKIINNIYHNYDK